MSELIQWEYDVMMEDNLAPMPSVKNSVSWLNKMGEQGWELVQKEGPYYIFKRPKITTPTKQEP